MQPPSRRQILRNAGLGAAFSRQSTAAGRPLAGGPSAALALKKGLILVKDTKHAVTLSHAVARLRASTQLRFDVASPEDPRIHPNGKTRIDQDAQKAWPTFFGLINSYDFEIMLTAEPFVHPKYGARVVAEFYHSGKEPPQYLAELRPFYSEFLGMLWGALPQVDTICLTPGVEGAQYGGPHAQAPRIFIAENDTVTSEQVLRIYLNVLADTARRRGKTVAFWPHSWGITSEGIRRMREMLFDYPEVLILEEDYWPNNLWQAGSTQLPILKSLPPPDR